MHLIIPKGPSIPVHILSESVNVSGLATSEGQTQRKGGAYLYLAHYKTNTWELPSFIEN